MIILGHLIKEAIHLSQYLEFKEQSPLQKQENTLKNLLQKAKDTAFGQHYQFAKILKASNLRKAFREQVPTFDYPQMHQNWWYRSLEGEADVSWPGQIQFFAQTSGTTGSKSKKIPVSEEMRKAIRRTGIEMVLQLRNFELPPEVFEKSILMLGSSTNLQQEGHYQTGEISGIGAAHIPNWFNSFYKPGTQIASIDNWDERVQTIAKEAPQWDIGALCGIPAWLKLMLEEVIAYHELDTIHDIWPNLRLYASGGVAYEPYVKDFEHLTAYPLQFLDTYLASEGFLAFQARPQTKGMQLALSNGIYFEFVPFDEQNFPNGEMIDNPHIVDIEEIKAGQTYVPLISTCSGTWRYSIGDTILFTDAERKEIRITGRTKHFLNAAGSQLSVDKMNQAIQELEEKFDLEINEFTVSAQKQGGDFVHRWYLGTKTQVEASKIKLHLDEYLKKVNKNYGVARQKALKDIEVKIVPEAYFYDWHESRKKKGGQIKTPRVMKDEQFAEWEQFVEKKQGEKTAGFSS